MGRLLEPSSALLASIARILRPLVRLLIARGITLPAAVEMLKDAYVKVAVTDFRLGDAPPPDTRVSLLTGVHRKDIRRLRDADREPADMTALNVLSEVVTRWATDRRYRTREGKPRVLPRSTTARHPISFASLAYSISSDLKPRPILDELVRLDMVSIDGEENVTLNVAAFVPPKDADERNFFLGENVGDHLAAGVHNLSGGDPPFLDQAVYSDDLSPESVNALLHLSREQWSEVLQVVVRRTAELEGKDRAAGRATHRINVGMYFYAEPRAVPTEEDRS
jgi:Family of unknown function (DUF6502)